MDLRYIRPEDRRRHGNGAGFGTEWADTEPACFRSEAFAEDLAPAETTVAVARVRPGAGRHVARTGDRWSWFGLSAFALRGGRV